MSHVVFVHGIAQQQIGGPTIENAWILALAGGLETAGYNNSADRLRLPVGAVGRIEARMAYYADLFVRQFQGEAQGADDDGDEKNYTAEQNALREEIAMQWLERAAQHAEDPRIKNPARHELDQIRGPRPREEQQGFREFGRRAVDALCQVPGIAHAGLRAATAVNKTLGQVTRYLTEEDIRGEVQRRIAQKITADTRVIIGHSLGSVAAYEAVHQLGLPLDLLVTLGSPLGLPSIVVDRLRPAPGFPGKVRKWVNIADTNDLVASEPNLGGLFGWDVPDGSEFRPFIRVDNEGAAHSAERYLIKKEVGTNVGPVFP
jgi:hypothetical protein